MDSRTYERLKRQFEAKRSARIEAAEADYREEIKALELIWASIHGPQGQAPEPVVGQPVTPTAVAQTARTNGLRVSTAMRQIIPDFLGDFTPDDIIRRIKELHPDLEIKRQTVTDALWRMAEKGEIEVVVVGKGRRVGVYRVPKPAGGPEAQTEPGEGQPVTDTGGENGRRVVDFSRAEVV